MPKVETEERMGSSAPVEIDGIQISELQMRKKSHKHDLFTIDLHRSAKSTERMDGEWNGRRIQRNLWPFFGSTLIHARHTLNSLKHMRAGVWVCLCLLRTYTHTNASFACTPHLVQYPFQIICSNSNSYSDFFRTQIHHHICFYLKINHTKTSNTLKVFMFCVYRNCCANDIIPQRFTLCIIKCTNLAAIYRKWTNETRRKKKRLNGNSGSGSSNPKVWYVWLVSISCWAASDVAHHRRDMRVCLCASVLYTQRSDVAAAAAAIQMCLSVCYAVVFYGLSLSVCWLMHVSVCAYL